MFIVLLLKLFIIIKKNTWGSGERRKFLKQNLLAYVLWVPGRRSGKVPGTRKLLNSFVNVCGCVCECVCFFSLWGERFIAYNFRLILKGVY